MKVYRYYFQGQTKFTWATCMLKLPNVAQQNCLFPNKEIIFLAGCELHIQTLAFLIILTLKNISPPKPVKCETLIVMTIIDSLSRLMRPLSQLTLEVFPGKWIVFEPSLHWSIVFSLHCTLSLPFIFSLQSVFCTDCIGCRTFPIWLMQAYAVVSQPFCIFVFFLRWHPLCGRLWKILWRASFRNV